MDFGNAIDTDACTTACTIAACGDGFVQAGEACDAGADNSDGGDCTLGCEHAACGDGLVHDQGSGSEACDNGPDNGPQKGCLADCSLNVCGDGDRGPGEGCDDGNLLGGDGCSSLCALEECGNGLVDPGEECDDGMDHDQDDGCTDLCRFPTCGDGFTQPSLGEECDTSNANSNSGACLLSCKHATCGDGYRWVSVEQCDGGEDNGEDQPCKPDCTGAICGDSFVGPGEPCDDGNLSNNDACTNACKAWSCGDGFVQLNEQCDEGEGNDNLGTCTLACKLPACGDGFVQASEACDDKNAVQTDNCLNNCQLPTCGDGLVWTGHEQCDDGNAVEGDGCYECAPGKRVFVTGTGYTGNLGGLSGAVAKCQERANTFGLGGTWDVWLSDDGSSPSTRFVSPVAGYRRLDGTIVANSLADLTDGTIDASINVTENGGTITTDAWTGTSPTGEAITPNCNNWTSSSSGVTGKYGRTNSVTTTWSDNGTAAACNASRRLYCFEI